MNKKEFKKLLKEQFGGKYQVAYWETIPYEESGEDVIYVGLSKTSLNALEESELPDEIGGVRVVYEYAGKIQVLTRQFYDPLIGGISIGATDVTAGTYGGIVWKDKKPYLLTNEHVVSNTSNTDPGHPASGVKIVQPGILDGGTKTAGYLEVVGGMKEAAMNGRECTIDAALVEPARDFMEEEYIGLGEVESYKHAGVEPGVAIIKAGRTTGVTRDEVAAVEVAINIGGIAWANPVVMEDVIMTKTSFSEGGDSGSRVWRKDTMQPIGIVFAGSSMRSMIIPAETICKKFNVSFGDKEPSKKPSKNKVSLFQRFIFWLLTIFRRF